VVTHHRDRHATIFVSPDVARPVEDIRRRWDGVMAAQIAAHVTLAYRREAPLAEVLAERLRAASGTVRPFRLRLGEVAYFGRPQDGVYVAVDDLDGWLIDHRELEGPVNVSSPNPVAHAEFMRTLRAAWGIPIGLPATRWMLELGALLLRTETELVLKSRRVVPGRLLRSSFSFGFPTWPEAAADLCRRWREGRP